MRNVLFAESEGPVRRYPFYAAEEKGLKTAKREKQILYAKKFSIAEKPRQCRSLRCILINAEAALNGCATIVMTKTIPAVPAKSVPKKEKPHLQNAKTDKE